MNHITRYQRVRRNMATVLSVWFSICGALCIIGAMAIPQTQLGLFFLILGCICGIVGMLIALEA